MGFVLKLFFEVVQMLIVPHAGLMESRRDPQTKWHWKRDRREVKKIKDRRRQSEMRIFESSQN